MGFLGGWAFCYGRGTPLGFRVIFPLPSLTKPPRVFTSVAAYQDRLRVWSLGFRVQGYLANEKLQSPRTLQQDYAQSPMMVLGGGGAVSYERGTPVEGLLSKKETHQSRGLRQKDVGRPTMVLGLPLQGYLAHNKTPTPLGPP